MLDSVVSMWKMNHGVLNKKKKQSQEKEIKWEYDMLKIQYVLVFV